jgi:hypothetical protein
MARRKTTPELVREKYSLAERLRAIRAELFGERGGPEMARRLGIPVRTWYNYEAGVTVPAEVVLRIIELTSLEPSWLLSGKGPKFRVSASESALRTADNRDDLSVRALLRTALRRLEKDAEASPHLGESPTPRDAGIAKGEDHPDGEIVVDGDDRTSPRSLSSQPGVNDGVASREWFEARRESRCIQVVGDAMSPLLSDGAYVAFARSEESPRELDGKLVVALGEVPPIVRWFQDCGRYALLRAEKSAVAPVLVDLEDHPGSMHFRRVLWIDTPH